MKKTKKQKLLSDLRRKIARVEQQIEKPADMLLEALPEKKEVMTPKTISFTQIVKSSSMRTEALSIDYSQISNDLKKTIFTSFTIISLLVILKFILK